MLPTQNEPNGINENQKRNNAELSSDDKAKLEKEETDYSQNDIAGNASGNLPPEEKEDSEDESATDTDGKGFVGDFAKPQHDD
ncbi:MAG: hypothetical protein EOO47_04880 [Flavobacterium sp.]|jgi:hypothetical protein|nr:MAG: hypothetical protein EOO47_04880 [Flavobacterium sp.]